MDIEVIKNKFILLAETFIIPILFVNSKGDVIFEELMNFGLHPLYENQKDKFFNPLNFQPKEIFELPIIKKSVFSVKHVLISVFQDEIFQGTLFIGPYLSYPLSEEIINGIINDSRAFFYRDKVFQYYKSLPIIETMKMKNISVLSNHLFNNKMISPQLIANSESSESHEMNIKIQQSNLTVSDNMKAETSHNDHLFEKEILYIIKEGRIEDLKNFPFVKEEENASLLSKSSYIRSVKNHIITLITLVSRTSIEGGLQEEIAFSLHDSYIQKLEELNRLDDIRDLAEEVLYTYAKKVKNVKDNHYSKRIRTCQNYIYKHIYDGLTHDDIAEKVKLSPKYLSNLFKKEVGMSVSEYIQETKIKEAKKLLLYSETPILEICSILNYNDQSYFTKVFKKCVGVTPKQYREKNHILKK